MRNANRQCFVRRPRGIFPAISGVAFMFALIHVTKTCALLSPSRITAPGATIERSPRMRDRWAKRPHGHNSPGDRREILAMASAASPIVSFNTSTF